MGYLQVIHTLLLILALSLALTGCAAPFGGGAAPAPTTSPTIPGMAQDRATAPLVPSPTLPAVDPATPLPTPFPVTTAAPGTSQRFAITQSPGDKTDIYLVHIDSADVINLTNNSVADFGISWSPDGTRIAFASKRDGNTDIYVMQADGTHPQRLTHRPEYDFAPVWSPNGTQIAFEQRLSSAVSTIYVMMADGSNLTRLADGMHPVWSPDGTRLIFSDSIQSDSEIHLINADGSDERYLVNGNRPSWSPDGTRILFDYNGQVYTINVNGTDLTALADGIEPIWSPDGTRIALVSSTHTSRALAIMDADGTNLRDLAAGEASAPQWSPDGRMIAFRRNAAIGIGGGVVMIVRVDDGTEHSLARYDLGRIVAFAWQP